MLAGEYPLSRDEVESATRLQNLLLSGITCFIDLTAEDELRAYQASLPATFSGKPVRHYRFAIADHGVPESVQFMDAIQQVIDEALQAGDGVYVHCRAGIGRTGMTVGCHLVRQGHDGSQAINQLNELWQDNARSRHWPQVPETDEQEQFIHAYAQQHRGGARAMAAALPITPQQEQYQGAMLGMMVGDCAAGLLVHSGDAVPGLLSDADWSGEAAMAWAMADGLLQEQPSALDQMQRYLAIQKQGEYTARQQATTLPSVAQKAIGLWQWRRNPLAGSHDPAMLDAHPLLRCVPVALRYAVHPDVALREAAESARTTAQAPLVLDACRALTALLLSILEGVPANRLMMFADGQAIACLRALNLKPEVLELIDGGWRRALTQPAGEDVLTVLAAVCHAVATTNDFQAALLRATKGSTRPTLSGALAGALAGALYGVQGLPILWCESLSRVQELRVLSDRLLQVARAG